MMNVPYVTLVIPCYNEGPRLPRLWQGLVDFALLWPGRFDVVLVDDGSTDGGLTALSSLAGYADLADRIVCIRQENTGKGGALKAGVLAAKGDYILTLDADMAAAPTELLRWWELRDGFFSKEIFIGSRELPQSEVRDSFQRQQVGRMFNRLIRLMTGLPYRDTQCGFKLYPKGVAVELFSALRTMGWAHDVELLLRANRAGCAIVQMPLRWQAVEGSKISVWRDSWVMLLELIRIVTMRIR
jgi:glycosyltransferase involved in cell wall biosynthesis